MKSAAQLASLVQAYRSSLAYFGCHPVAIRSALASFRCQLVATLSSQASFSRHFDAIQPEIGMKIYMLELHKDLVLV